MIINYLGGDCVRIQFGDIVIAVNPPSKDSSVKIARFGADLALISQNNPNMNGEGVLGFGGREPFWVTGPGEYEFRGVMVRGFGDGSNTVYFVLLEGIKLCFLGAQKQASLSSTLVEALDGIDILFVPIGGENVLSPAEAYKLAVSIEPNMIIPVHFAGIGEKDALKRFLKEAGEEKLNPLDKLTIKKKDLEGKEGEIVILSADV